MNASTAQNTPPAHTPTVTLPDTSNSATIHAVAIQDSATGSHDRSTTSTCNDNSQRELTVKELSGKRGAHHRALSSQPGLQSAPVSAAQQTAGPIIRATQCSPPAQQRTRT